MSSASLSTRRGARPAWRPASQRHAALLDATLLIAAMGCALLPWRTTFDSSLYLGFGCLGALVGYALAQLARWGARSLPAGGRGAATWVAAALLGEGAFLALAYGLGLRGADGIDRLIVLPIEGWRDLLTTLPPIEATGVLGGLPLWLGIGAGLICGLLGSQRSTSGVVLVPVIVFALAIVTGTEADPIAAAAPALVAVTIVWAALRWRRGRRVSGTGGSRPSQAVTAVALLALAGAGGVGLGSHLPGVESRPRLLARTQLDPPFDINQFPSPLSGFRRFGEGLKLLWDQPLLTVSGAEPGSRVRFAVLDSYNGTVWSAGTATTGGGLFHRVGHAMAPPEVLTGAPREVDITVEAAYAALADVRPWVPALGYPVSVTFRGQGAQAASDDLRYNPASGQLLVPGGLSAGTQIRIRQIPVAQASPGGVDLNTAAVIDQGAGSFLAAWAVEWSGEATRPWDRLMSIGRHLSQTGAFSDGTKKGEEEFWPGHSVGRLLAMVAAEQPVGSDEQFAATFALMAQQVGAPARVVFGAVIPTNGLVVGRDVHAWVEVQSASGEWFAIPNAMFMPDRSERPKNSDFQEAPPADQAVVPPQTPRRPPGAADSLIEGVPPLQRPRSGDQRNASPGTVGVPPWVRSTAKYVGGPLALMGGSAVLFWGARALRRLRRRSHRDPTRRLALGWRDLVDHARDLGADVDRGATRREQAGAIGFAPLAAKADRAVFGVGHPSEAEIRAYWTEITAARRTLSRAGATSARVLRLWRASSLFARD
jgi:hypothetical protein